MSDEKEFFIRAKTDSPLPEDDTFTKQDPFNHSWDVIKDLQGLDANFKRRTTRVLKGEATPAYMESSRAESTGRDGAKSKEINSGTVFRNAYGLFDVITPPWNLYELASFYDTSFANHAAIDAKVENIVGLGYEFKVAKRTMLKLEASEPKTAENARRRIQRAKIELSEIGRAS